MNTQKLHNLLSREIFGHGKEKIMNAQGFFVSRGNSIGIHSDWFPPVATIELARNMVADLNGDAIIWQWVWDNDREEWVASSVE